MGLTPIKLNLVPEPSFWRERHTLLGWVSLGLGLSLFLGATGYTAWSYHRANQAGKAAIMADSQTRMAATQEQQILSKLQQIDVDLELPRWRLAERILSERAAPWSRLVAELEQSLVDGTRIKSLERTRGANQSLLLKLKGESRDRAAESGFIENLRKDPVFTQVILEREAQEQGGGWEFDLSLPVTPLPPPFVPLAADKGNGAEPSPAPAAPAVVQGSPKKSALAAKAATTTPVKKPSPQPAPFNPRGKGEVGAPPPNTSRAQPSQRRPEPGGGR